MKKDEVEDEDIADSLHDSAEEMGFKNEQGYL